MATQLSRPDNSHFAAQAPAVKGATGTPTPIAGRANPSLDRNHWSFDPVAYRQNWLMQTIDPDMARGVVLCAAVVVCAGLLAVGLGLVS